MKYKDFLRLKKYAEKEYYSSAIILKKKTGVTLQECIIALSECYGDTILAVELLRKNMKMK